MAAAPPACTCNCPIGNKVSPFVAMTRVMDTSTVFEMLKVRNPCCRAILLGMLDNTPRKAAYADRSSYRESGRTSMETRSDSAARAFMRRSNVKVPPRESLSEDRHGPVQQDSRKDEYGMLEEEDEDRHGPMQQDSRAGPHSREEDDEEDEFLDALLNSQ